MEVAASSSDNIRNISLLASCISELARETLIIMNMPGEYDIRNALGPSDRLIEDSAHIDASARECIKGINGVVHNYDEGLILRGRLHFCMEPGNLVIVELAAFRHVRVEADNGGVRCLQGPVNVGLGHRMTLSIAGFRGDVRCLVAKVIYERGHSSAPPRQPLTPLIPRTAQTRHLT